MASHSVELTVSEINDLPEESLVESLLLSEEPLSIRNKIMS